MSQNFPPLNPEPILLSREDIDRAAAEGVLSATDADQLVSWACGERSRNLIARDSPRSAPERSKGFNLVMVLYYFGAMLMISACAWFLGDKWDSLGASGICMTTITYMAVATGIGWWLRRRCYLIGGGLLITVAVCLTPLLTYSIEEMIGWWPAQDPGSYADFYPMIHGSWIVMELATIVAAIVALRFVHFGFLTAPLAFLFWFLSMDLTGLIYKQNYVDLSKGQWVSVGVGLFTMLVGFVLDFVLRRQRDAGTEDFAFWCYLFGLAAFWGGLTAAGAGSEPKRFAYLLVNLALIGIAIRIER